MINLKINNMKKKMTLSLILTLLLGFSALAQNYVILVKPAGAEVWGYANINGDLIIEAKYKKCIGFSEEGFAAIYDAKVKQFYFINLKGETLQTEITGFKLIEIFGFGMKGFDDGFAPVKLNEKWGFLNTDGKLAVPAKYDKVTPFDGGYTPVQRDGKFFVLDKNGVEFPVEVPGIMDLNNFSEQLASYKTAGELVGFVDAGGRVVIQAQFISAGDFYGGMAWAKNNAELVGYINPKGNWIIEPQFETGKNFDQESGMARVKTGDRWAYVNKAGEIMHMNDSDIFDDFHDGLARGRKNEKFGFFDNKGEWAIQPQFDGARDFKNGYASVKKGELWGVIDKTGKWMIEPKFDDIKDVEMVK
jgi:hypothetical protein